MNEEQAIPYMGSKRKIANKIVNYILDNNPNCKYFYDLFGGGGAISFNALQKGLIVHYNEIDSAIVELIKKIRTDLKPVGVSGITIELIYFQKKMRDLKNYFTK